MGGASPVLKNWPLACPHPAKLRWPEGASPSLLTPREAGMRKSGGGLWAWTALRAWGKQPAASGMWKPIKGRRLSPHLTLPSTQDSLKHSCPP